jgi:excinuclease ABC, C subunit
LDEDLGLSPKISDGSDAYKAGLRKLISYIKGNRKAIAVELERDMKTAAGLHDFERAASLRNKLRAMQELQRRVMFGDKEFLDISKDMALADLAKLLGLKNIPVRIEGYDISHMSGRQVVASMVVFTNGASDRAEYRKFKVGEKNDDTGNMYEVIFRRLGERNIKSWGRPDLLLVDGGKGQLSAAIKARDERRIKLPIISIAKREEEIIIHKTGSQIDMSYIEELQKSIHQDVTVHEDNDVYVVNLHPAQRNAGSHSKNLRGSAIDDGSSRDNFTKSSIATTDIVKLFQRIRDESHRFAVSYHTALKRQNQTKNQLEEIPGIGPKTRAKLLKKFGSVKKIIEADYAELQAEVGSKKANLIKRLS